MLRKITKEEALIKFGQEPFDVMDEEGYAFSGLSVSTLDGESDVLGADLYSATPDDAEPAVWDDSTGTWDFL